MDFREFDRELPITLQIKNKEIIYIILPIVFNRKDVESKKAAIDYHSKLFNQFAEQAYLPYRLNSLLVEEFFDSNSAIGKLMKKIKKAFDDKNILNFKRYNY